MIAMKLQMAENSLFAILLRKPWWVSLGIAAVLGLVAMALLPPAYRVVGALSGFPFVVIAALAAWRQRRLPSQAEIAQTRQALAAMNWPAFSSLLEQAFRRDGYSVQRSTAKGVDFELERQGRRMLVSARRWKSARSGIDALQPLQVQREAIHAADALFVGLGPISDTARPFAAQHRIAVWQAAELAQALRGLPLG